MRFSKSVLAGLVLVAMSATAQATPHECIKDSVLLRNKYHKPQKTELDAIKELVEVRSEGSRSVEGLNEFKQKDAGGKSVCSESANPCFKLLRNARKKGFSHVRRLAHNACSPNYVVYADQQVEAAAANPTNDSMYRYQKRDWNAINAPQAWRRSHGDASVVVAVIDTGVDYTHPDLAGNVLTAYGRNFATATVGYDPMDDNGHGTHVAGTIGAVGNNGLGVAGVAWNVGIVPLKFLDANGSGSLSGAVQAIDYMVELKQQGVNIVVANNSWGGGGYSAPLAAAISSANDAGIVFTAAAGNEANDNDASPSYPADYDISNVVSVGAVDTSDMTLAYFSNYGSSVDIAGPGVDIASTYPGGRYAQLSGTSMATPHVTGAIALLKAYESSLDKDGLINRILSTARYTKSLVGSVASGRMLNVRNALTNNSREAAPPKKKAKKANKK